MTRQTGTQHRERYSVRLLRNELSVIQQSAAIAGLTASEYIRRSALNKRIHSRVHVQLVGQISRLGGLQKYLLTQIKGQSYEASLRDQLDRVLAELHRTLRQIAADSRG